MTSKDQEYRGSIRSIQLGATNITEDQIRQMYGRKGSFHMGVVEVKVEETHENAAGTRRVDLILKQVDLIVGDDPDDLDNHLREITNRRHRDRKLKGEDGQLTIETAADLEPSVKDVVAAQRAHWANEPHVFDPPEDDTDSDEPDACRLCGEDLDHELHAVVTAPEPAASDPQDDEDQDEQDDAAPA